MFMIMLIENDIVIEDDIDNCGSNAFKGYFDDAKEFKNQEKDSREVSSFKFSRIKNQE